MKRIFVIVVILFKLIGVILKSFLLLILLLAFYFASEVQAYFEKRQPLFSSSTKVPKKNFLKTYCHDVILQPNKTEITDIVPFFKCGFGKLKIDLSQRPVSIYIARLQFYNFI